MKTIVLPIIKFIFSIFKTRLSLQIEIAVLRHQLMVYQRKKKKLVIKPTDRMLWSLISKIRSGWKNALYFVKPATVTAWRRKKFKDYWAKLSGSGKLGRPAVDPKTIRLIRDMSKANPLWGSPRIRDELKKIGINLAKSTIEKYMVKHRKPPSPTWRAFLNNHVKDLVSVDFFVVPTFRNTVLFVFLILAHDRRRVVHFNVTKHPTAKWTAQQIVEAFPLDTAPKYLLRDRDKIYGSVFQNRVKNMNIKEVKIAPHNPWQSPYVERLIGSIRRECLDHVIVLNERHLKRILTGYFGYYHRYRTHLSLDSDCPESRPVQSKEIEKVIAFPEVGGLHHHYERKKAA